MTEHKFGGEHTELKLDIVRSYTKSFLNVMKNQGFNKVYIDAFAGSGNRTETNADGSRKTMPGSVRQILNLEKNFDEYIFIEKDRNRFIELKKVEAEYPNLCISCSQGDSNEKLVEYCSQFQRKKPNNSWGNRGVIFLDPYGMSVKWDTLEAIAKTKAIDVWFLFPSLGMLRQMTMNLDDINKSKIESINRALGTDMWQKAIYTTNRGLFGDETERDSGTKAINEFMASRLKEIFAGDVFGPIVIKSDKSNHEFGLFLAISNPSPQAVKIAKRIYNSVKKSQPLGLPKGIRPKSVPSNDVPSFFSWPHPIV